MAKVDLKPIIEQIEVIQAIIDLYPKCEYDHTQEQLFTEIKSKVRQLNDYTIRIKSAYEKQLELEALDPEERKFREFIERNMNKQKEN